MPDDVDGQLIEDTYFELDDFDKDLNTSKVKFHVRKTESRLRRELPNSTDEEALADLIPLSAAIRLIENDKDAFLSSKGATDVDKSWDVETFIEGLRERRDDLLTETDEQWAVTVTRDGTNSY
ncbi:hypothetical protein [Saliphagus sp. LR7]|uniref:hypothetical protein n=1 Tax=Saliphagus sp. LR7 TaxID=2282654 RepID=UPI000DF74EDD|nr:hypothetical protein [Saliphagus sp. LR7]